MTDFKIDMDIPGWILKPEIIKLCEFIENSNCTDILEVGSFAGRLTHSLCTNFPNKSVTVVDLFKCYEPHLNFYDISQLSYMICGEKFNNDHFNENFFRKLHTYDNLKIKNSDVLDYNDKHEIVIMSFCPEVIGQTWEILFDHCLKISKNHTIGAFSVLGDYNEGGYITLYEKYDFDFTINTENNRHLTYEILGKKLL